jgi:hypothetical protein
MPAGWFFESSADLVPGKNPGLGREISLLNQGQDVQADNPRSPSVLGTTDVNFLPSINAAGTFVTFNSRAQPRSDDAKRGWH